MKKRIFKSLELNKKSVSTLNQHIRGGAILTFDILCQTAPDPGPDSDHTCYFSCAGNDMPSCNYTDCN